MSNAHQRCRDERRIAALMLLSILVALPRSFGHVSDTSSTETEQEPSEEREPFWSYAEDVIVNLSDRLKETAHSPSGAPVYEALLAYMGPTMPIEGSQPSTAPKDTNVDELLDSQSSVFAAGTVPSDLGLLAIQLSEGFTPRDESEQTKRHQRLLGTQFQRPNKQRPPQDESTALSEPESNDQMPHVELEELDANSIGQIDFTNAETAFGNDPHVARASDIATVGSSHAGVQPVVNAEATTEDEVDQASDPGGIIPSSESADPEVPKQEHSAKLEFVERNTRDESMVKEARGTDQTQVPDLESTIQIAKPETEPQRDMPHLDSTKLSTDPQSLESFEVLLRAEEIFSLEIRSRSEIAHETELSLPEPAAGEEDDQKMSEFDILGNASSTAGPNEVEQQEPPDSDQSENADTEGHEGRLDGVTLADEALGGGYPDKKTEGLTAGQLETDESMVKDTSFVSSQGETALAHLDPADPGGISNGTKTEPKLQEEKDVVEEAPKPGSIAEFFKKVKSKRAVNFGSISGPLSSAKEEATEDVYVKEATDSPQSNSPTEDDDPSQKDGFGGETTLPLDHADRAYGYTSVWGRRRQTAKESVLHAAKQGDSSREEGQKMAETTDSTSTQAVGSGSCEPVEDDTINGQRATTSNDEFVDGLDDVDKFFEAVNPPEELDISAGGSSMQEVLVGQGSQILLKRVAMGFGRIRQLFGRRKNHVENSHALLSKEFFAEAPMKLVRVCRKLIHLVLDAIEDLLGDEIDGDDDDGGLIEEANRIEKLRQRALAERAAEQASGDQQQEDMIGSFIRRKLRTT